MLLSLVRHVCCHCHLRRGPELLEPLLLLELGRDELLLALGRELPVLGRALDLLGLEERGVMDLVLDRLGELDRALGRVLRVDGLALGEGLLLGRVLLAEGRVCVRELGRALSRDWSDRVARSRTEGRVGGVYVLALSDLTASPRLSLTRGPLFLTEGGVYIALSVLSVFLTSEPLLSDDPILRGVLESVPLTFGLVVGWVPRLPRTELLPADLADTALLLSPPLTLGEVFTPPVPRGP
jgi:hypothetical protein